VKPSGPTNSVKESRSVSQTRTTSRLRASFVGGLALSAASKRWANARVEADGEFIGSRTTSRWRTQHLTARTEGV
jgi:hypothetical protein